ncbi:MAG: hypothetical protein M9941_08275 [Anaerolineae bacterium]|nr:hypothetical protein [Anaerolineae bacterium]MCO5191903.1 hypothetical protein [Anaerolineae bacterium]MCO5197721.1 hypothetical protein [Anaerolineae bacterium]
MRGIVDHKGEQFGYLDGNRLYTLDGETSGFLREGYIVDLAGNPVWRVIGDCLYKPGTFEQVGFLSEGKNSEYG